MLRTSMNFGSLSASIVPYRDVDGKDISKGQKGGESNLII